MLAAWPRDRWLAALISSGQGERDRWSIIAQPAAAVPVIGGRDSGGQGRLLLHPRLAIPRDVSVPIDPDRPPFVGGWIASLRYELGGVIEPASGVTGEGWNAMWFWCPSALAYDHLKNIWWWVRSAEPVPGVTPIVPESEWPTYQPPAPEPTPSADFRVGELATSITQEMYVQRVRSALEHIAAGDIYQVNLTHSLRGSFEGSSRAMMLRLLQRARPWYGSYVEYPLDHSGAREAIASASPEMFLSITREGRITTRPMKGTRAGSTAAAADELAASEKERAELTMIVDLMRNDLGRVCMPGTIQVDEPRAIEQHATGTEQAPGASALLQATATVSGQLRRQTTLGDVLAATFPGGSVTGAPKIRAMQIIKQLEGEPRGQYCGCLGFISDCGNAAFSIAIRTASMRGPVAPEALDAFQPGSAISYGVGAGIVADSDPEAEWRETLDKAGVLLEAAEQQVPLEVPPVPL